MNAAAMYLAFTSAHRERTDTAERTAQQSAGASHENAAPRPGMLARLGLAS